MHQEGVQRIVPRHQHHQGTLPAPSGPAGLLPERADGARKSGDHHRVEPGDVDTEFQRVGGGQPAQMSFGQRVFESAAVLGEISGAIGRHLLGHIRRDVVQPRPGGQRRQLRTPAGTHEGQRLRALRHQIGHDPRCLGSGGPSHRCAVLAEQIKAQRRFPQRHRARTMRGAVVGDLLDRLADELSRRRRGRGGRRAGEDDRRLYVRAGVTRTQPQQPAQHHRHVRAENPSIMVTFVDDDEPKRTQQHRPARMIAQHRQVDHVRIGEQPP